MPIRVGVRGKWQTIVPTADLKVMPNTLPNDQFEVATELCYLNVTKQ